MGEKAGQSLADPQHYPNLFPSFGDSLNTEKYLKEVEGGRRPASLYPGLAPNPSRCPIEEMQHALSEGSFVLRDEDSVVLPPQPPQPKASKPQLYDEDDLELEIENMNLDDIDPNVRSSLSQDIYNIN